MAQTITDLVALGGYWAVGSHGQQHGLGSPWDVWMAKAAGPMTALEVASMMVLNGNPLENIRNTANIQYVMKAGVLSDANSLDQIWPRAIKFGDTYWVMPEMYRIDEKR